MKLLIDLYKISAPSGSEHAMVDFVEAYLNSLEASTYRDASNNLYATKGMSETYPCVVAHTDEVHAVKPKSFEVFQLSDMIVGIDTVKSKYIGIGADDKNGIWVALKAFEQMDAIKGAFFVSEEIGCVGSRRADMSFFDDCRYVLQCDRKGSSDFIVNAAGVDLSTNEFIKDIGLEEFGYKEAFGSITDVMQLKDNGLNICAANISCGYYNAHTENEYTVMSELKNSLELVLHIMNNLTEVYPHEYTPYYENGHHYRSYFDYPLSGLELTFEREEEIRSTLEAIVLDTHDDTELMYESIYKYHEELKDGAEQDVLVDEFEYLMGHSFHLEEH